MFHKNYWVLLISMKLWGPTWFGSVVELFVDNMAVCMPAPSKSPRIPRWQVSSGSLRRISRAETSLLTKLISSSSLTI